MRKLLLLAMALTMVCGGLYVAVADFLWTPIIHGKFVVGAAVLVVIGSYLLWADFLAPWLGMKGD
jgi:hypothetical protein